MPSSALLPIAQPYNGCPTPAAAMQHLKARRGRQGASLATSPSSAAAPKGGEEGTSTPEPDDLQVRRPQAPCLARLSVAYFPFHTQTIADSLLLSWTDPRRSLYAA